MEGVILQKVGLASVLPFSITFFDIIDILIVSFLIYQVLYMIKGTKAVQMLMGLVFLFILYYTSQVFRLTTLNWMLDNVLSSLILIIIVIFQNDLRRLLMTVGSNPFFGGMSKIEESQIIDEISGVCSILASRRIGAILVFQRNVGLKTYIDSGIILDAKVSKELLMSIFPTNSPLHDGALILEHGKFKAARCLLPLSMNPLLSKTLGTRHRAALGISEETDAVAVVVSEERGTISLAYAGQLIASLGGTELRNRLYQLLEMNTKKKQIC